MRQDPISTMPRATNPACPTASNGPLWDRKPNGVIGSSPVWTRCRSTNGVGMPNAAEVVAGIADGYGHQNTLVDSLSARIEMELGELEPDEAGVFMEELGIAESGLDRVIGLSYRLLGLISFLTLSLIHI